MKTGLLWYDDNPDLTLREYIARACARYKQKQGQVPNTCYIHPSAMPDDVLTKVGPVRVVIRTTVLKHHFWVGKADTKATKTIA